VFNGGSVSVTLVVVLMFNDGSVGVQWRQCWFILVINCSSVSVLLVVVLVFNGGCVSVLFVVVLMFNDGSVGLSWW
jgi:hypothetical protein